MLCTNIVDDSKWTRKRTNRGEKDRDGVEKQQIRTRVSYDSWTALLSPWMSRCPFMELPVPGGGRETPTYTKQRPLLCCWEKRGRKGWEGWEKRCEQRDYELCPLNVQMLTVGTNHNLILLHHLRPNQNLCLCVYNDLCYCSDVHHLQNKTRTAWENMRRQKNNLCVYVWKMLLSNHVASSLLSLEQHVQLSHWVQGHIDSFCRQG